MGDSCIFCDIVNGEIPSDIVYRDDDVVAFRDIQPQAAVHVLVVPIVHYDNVVEVAALDSKLLAHIVSVAKMLAEESYNGQFRLVFNTGQDAGQTVLHAHAHVLTGEPLDE